MLYVSLFFFEEGKSKNSNEGSDNELKTDSTFYSKFCSHWHNERANMRKLTIFQVNLTLG